MKRFELKWKECVAQCGKGNPGSDSIPVGFAERVLRQVKGNGTSAALSEEIWLRFGIRTLIGVATVLVALALIHRPQSKGWKLVPPPIEQSIVKYSKLL